MKKYLALFAFLIASAASAQTNRFPPINWYGGDPTGNACTMNSPLLQSQTTGYVYDCNPNTLVYQQATSGGGGVPTCSAGQMAYYNSSGAIQACLNVGSGLSIAGGTITATGGSGGVSSLNSLTGALNITPGPGIAITPSGTSIEVTNTAPNIELAVTAFGALANAVYVDTGTGGNYYNTGDSYVTSYVGFTSADVGKYLVLQSGAHGGAWPPYPATQGEPGNVVKILAVSGNYALVDKASLTTGHASWFIGTDNVPAFNACATYATNLGGATCAVPPGNYLMVTYPYYVTSGVAQDDGGYESPAGGSGAVVTATVAGGGITGYTVTNGGSGYPHSAQMQMTFTGGCPAVYAGPCGGEYAIANTNSSGVVSTVTAVYNGYGLTTAPTVAVVPLGGDGATATCTLTGGTCGTPSIGAGGAGYVHSGTVNIFAVSNSCTYTTGGLALGDGYYVEGQGTATTNSSGVVTSATWSTAPVGCSVAPAIVFGNVSCWNGGTSAFTSQCTNLAPLLPAAMPVQVMMQPNVSWLGPGGAYSAGVELIGVWDYLTYDTPTPGSMLTEPAMFGGPLAFSDVTGIGIKQAFVGLFASNNANYSSVHDMTFTNDALGLLTASMDNGFKIADLNFSSDGASLVNGGAWAHRTDYQEGQGGFSEPVSISNLHIISSGSNSAIDDWFAEEFWKPEFSSNAVDFLEPCAFPQTPSQRQTSKNLANAISGANWGCYKGVVGFGWENLSRDDLAIPVGFPINSLYASGITRAMFYGVLGANTITGYSCEACPAMATDPYRASSLQEGLIEYVHGSNAGTLTVNGLEYDLSNAEPVNVYQDIYDILNGGFPYSASWQNLNSSYITHPLIPNNLDYQYATSLAPSTGGPDCLQIATTGLISNTGSPCGSGGGGTTTNALTAAATGGADPGSTFNGSALVTFDYHSFGAQPTLSLLAGTYADGNMCTYASSGTLLNCNTTIPSVGTWGALNYPTWASGTPFVKMTAAGTFALDTNTYLTSLPSTVVQTNQANSYTAGNKQTFQASATTAGFSWGGVTADPSAPANGDEDYRTDLTRAGIYTGSAWHRFAYTDDTATNAINLLGTAGTLNTAAFANATSGTITLEAASGAITSYALQLPVAQPTAGNTGLSCTAANPSVCTWAASGGGTPSYPVTVAGTVTSGGIPYFNSTTQSSSSGILNTNILVKGGGAGGAPTNSSITDNGTSIITAEPFTSSAIGNVPLTINGYSSGQTADLLDVYDYAGHTKKVWVDSGGNLNTATNIAVGPLTIGSAVYASNFSNDGSSTQFGQIALGAGSTAFTNNTITGAYQTTGTSLSNTYTGTVINGQFKPSTSFTLTNTGVFNGLLLNNTFGNGSTTTMNGLSSQLSIQPVINIATTSTGNYTEIYSKPTETSVSAGVTNYFIQHYPSGGSNPTFNVLQSGFTQAVAVQSIGTKFTVSGCSVSSTTGGAAAGKMTLGANTCSVVITMNGATGVTATNGWSCHANDETTAAGNTLLYFSANSATTATLSVPATAGTTDVIDFACQAF